MWCQVHRLPGKFQFNYLSTVAWEVRTSSHCIAPRRAWQILIFFLIFYFFSKESLHNFYYIPLELNNGETTYLKINICVLILFALGNIWRKVPFTLKPIWQAGEYLIDGCVASAFSMTQNSKVVLALLFKKKQKNKKRISSLTPLLC